MSSKGLKSQLIARLMKAVKFESDKESEEKEKKEQEEVRNAVVYYNPQIHRGM